MDQNLDNQSQEHATDRASNVRASGDAVSGVTADELILRGYRKYPAHRDRHADFLFQKRVDVQGEGVGYFINIFQYVGLHEGRDGWMPAVQFYLDADRSRHIDFTLGGFTDIGEIEDVIAAAYISLGAQPYERMET